MGSHTRGRAVAALTIAGVFRRIALTVSRHLFDSVKTVPLRSTFTHHVYLVHFAAIWEGIVGRAEAGVLGNPRPVPAQVIK